MITMRLAALGETKTYEYVVRFLFGGVCTVLAELIAKRFGPVVGGLFLAFPAIFPAGASLIESHEKRRKRAAGFDGTMRGREAASLDAMGAALGTIGLAAFAAVVWAGLQGHNATAVIVVATMVWMAVSGGLWMLRRHGAFRSRRRLMKRS